LHQPSRHLNKPTTHLFLIVRAIQASSVARIDHNGERYAMGSLGFIRLVHIVGYYIHAPIGGSRHFNTDCRYCAVIAK